MTKLARLLGTDRPQGRGLEIGALDAPLVRKPEHDVRYVDYAATEVIRANQFDPSVKVAEIVEVDLVWGEAPLAELTGGPVDYVVASHVIEHVPDLIGWLAEIAQALRPDGVLALAIPDQRFTFDALRKPSVLAEAVEAWLASARRPSLRQVFDAAALGVAVDPAEVWAGAFDPATRRAEVLERAPRALGLVRRLQAAPRYNDAHCWVFTPRSFLDLAEELACLGLFPFAVQAFSPTEPGAAEFLVRLARVEDPVEIRRSIAEARERLAAAAQPPGLEQALAAAVAEVEATRLQLEAATAEVERLAQARASLTAQVEARTLELAALAQDRAGLRVALDAMLASTSWKATAPLRGLGRALGRLRGRAARPAVDRSAASG